MKNIKFKDNIYLDSTGIVHNKVKLFNILSNLIKTTKSSNDTSTYSCNYINGILMTRLTAGFNIDNLDVSGIYGIYNATGTLPSVFTANNNVILHNYMWDTDWGRQILYDIRANTIFSRQKENGNWNNWRKVTMTDVS